MDAIDEYFSGEARSRANSDSKSRPFNPATNNGPIFVVEFKAGRTDFFFIPEAEEKFASSGDLVIVEADRGKDLGKIVEEITYETFLEQSQSLSNLNVGSDGENVSTVAVSPKIIYRLADADDVSQLQAKALDEQKAMAVCQAKVRQKKLPMEVVDAEYQWDRRKLTFYFVADRRIDFRELVRELFKIYKTRIWMCAVERSTRKK
ncbi:PSP1-domain-containing protein [Rozella allomycis CSF55]|uniref:PSP1-domain-containing protein n=1 Tax=Rozella allomycis (strain CSF55) TaxID=988480 RepID=A0A4V1IZ53_ROZAC|nr:PSP1-domain-containing protein [Rozella allomycis CSF55]